MESFAFFPMHTQKKVGYNKLKSSDVTFRYLTTQTWKCQEFVPNNQSVAPGEQPLDSSFLG